MNKKCIVMVHSGISLMIINKLCKLLQGLEISQKSWNCLSCPVSHIIEEKYPQKWKQKIQHFATKWVIWGKKSNFPKWRNDNFPQNNAKSQLYEGNQVILLGDPRKIKTCHMCRNFFMPLATFSSSVQSLMLSTVWSQQHLQNFQGTTWKTFGQKANKLKK